MQKKRNEHVLGKMMREQGYYAHKWGDVRYCPFCKTPLPKAEKKPDFLIAKDYAFVEAKGASDAWTFDGDFRPNQREFMDNNTMRSWIFVEMGDGRAPNGKIAFLVPWTTWKVIEEQLLSTGFHSVLIKKTEKSRAPAIKEYLSQDYFLEWGKGGWTIPENHIWWIHEGHNHD